MMTRSLLLAVVLNLIGASMFSGVLYFLHNRPSEEFKRSMLAPETAMDKHHEMSGKFLTGACLLWLIPSLLTALTGSVAIGDGRGFLPFWAACVFAWPIVWLDLSSPPIGYLGPPNL